MISYERLTTFYDWDRAVGEAIAMIQTIPKFTIKPGYRPQAEDTFVLKPCGYLIRGTIYRVIQTINIRMLRPVLDIVEGEALV